MEPPAQQPMCGSHSMEKPADFSGLCGNVPDIHSCQRNKIVGSHTLRKIQTWISTWLISVTVLDPTKILDLNFKEGFSASKLGNQAGLWCTRVCAAFALGLCCFCVLSCSSTYQNCFISFINSLLRVSDATNTSKFPHHYRNGELIIPSWSPLRWCISVQSRFLPKNWRALSVC